MFVCLFFSFVAVIFKWVAYEPWNELRGGLGLWEKLKIFYERATERAVSEDLFLKWPPQKPIASSVKLVSSFFIRFVILIGCEGCFEP